MKQLATVTFEPDFGLKKNRVSFWTTVRTSFETPAAPVLGPA